jgi:hypothetical protein
MVGHTPPSDATTDQDRLWAFFSCARDYRDFYPHYATDSILITKFDPVKQRKFACPQDITQNEALVSPTTAGAAKEK